MKRKVSAPGGLLSFNTVCACVCGCVTVSFMNCHSCLRQLPEGLYSIRAPPLSLLLKTCPLFPYTNNYGCSLSHTLRASHNYRVQCLHLRIYANSFWSPSRTAWEDGGNCHSNSFKHACVCVFSCWYNVMKTISSLAVGHGSDTNQSEHCDEKSLPCRGCVTLAVGNGDCGCCASTLRDFFAPRCDLWAADSAKCPVILWPVKSS